jgi:hypothetical protein
MEVRRRPADITGLIPLNNRQLLESMYAVKAGLLSLLVLQSIGIAYGNHFPTVISMSRHTDPNEFN